MAFLWHYIKRRPVLHLAAIGSVVAAATFAWVSQYGLKLIVDALAGGPQHIAAVWWALAVFVALVAGESVLWRCGSWFGYRAMLADKAEAKLDLFNHLSGHCGRYFSDRLGGALANRISGTGDAVQQVFSVVLFNIAPVCADFCAALALLATIEWHLVAALCAFVLLAAGALARFSRRGTPRHRLHADRAAEVAGELVDVLSNIWVVKAFSARTRERSRFERLLEIEEGAHRDSLMYVERLRVLHDLALWLMAAACSLGPCICGARASQPRRCHPDRGDRVPHPARLARSGFRPGQCEPVHRPDRRCDPGDRREPPGRRPAGRAPAGPAGRQHRVRECRVFLSRW